MQGLHRLRARVPARLIVVVVAVCVLALGRASTAQAIPAGTVSMTPASQSLSVGQSVLVNVDVSNSTNINDVALRITYNPAVVSVTDYDNVAAGVQILPGWFPGTDLNYQTEGSVITNSVNPAGQINYEYQLSGSAVVSGGGTVATIQFQALANGNADVQWSWVQIKDGSGTPSTPTLGDPAIIVVGGAVPTLTPTSAGTATPIPTSTPQITATSTGTATATRTPSATTTAAATATPRITVVANSNSATPAVGKPPASGVEPAATGKAGGLPSAGNNGGGTQWWKWTFFAGAMMLAVAGWFFTFALHAGDREVVLTDRFDRRRRRR